MYIVLCHFHILRYTLRGRSGISRRALFCTDPFSILRISTADIIANYRKRVSRALVKCVFVIRASSVGFRLRALAVNAGDINPAGISVFSRMSVHVSLQSPLMCRDFNVLLLEIS